LPTEKQRGVDTMQNIIDKLAATKEFKMCAEICSEQKGIFNVSFTFNAPMIYGQMWLEYNEKIVKHTSCYVCISDENSDEELNTTDVGIIKEIIDVLDRCLVGVCIVESIQEYSSESYHHEDVHDDDRDYDNSYSFSQQRAADLSDYAQQFDCPIQRAEIRMGA